MGSARIRMSARFRFAFGGPDALLGGANFGHLAVHLAARQRWVPHCREGLYTATCDEHFRENPRTDVDLAVG